MFDSLHSPGGEAELLFEDVRVPVEQAYALQRAYRRAGREAARLIKLKNAGHTPRLNEHWYEYQKASIEFFEQHIGKGVLPKAD